MKCSLDVKMDEWYRVSYPEDSEHAPSPWTFRALVRSLRGEKDYLIDGLDTFPYVRQRIFLHISAIFFGGISLGELENAWFGNPSADFLRETRVVCGPNYPLY